MAWHWVRSSRLKTVEQAVEAAHEMLDKFGDSGARVVIEEFLDGEEFLSCLCQWGQVYIMPAAQDHKRAYDGDKDQTQAVWAYAPVPHLPKSVIDQSVDTIVKPVLEGMIAEGRPYLGVLTRGLS